jgi:hypothetical protein
MLSTREAKNGNAFRSNMHMQTDSRLKRSHGDSAAILNHLLSLNLSLPHTHTHTHTHTHSTNTYSIRMAASRRAAVVHLRLWLAVDRRWMTRVRMNGMWHTARNASGSGSR